MGETLPPTIFNNNHKFKTLVQTCYLFFETKQSEKREKKSQSIPERLFSSLLRAEGEREEEKKKSVCCFFAHPSQTA